MATPASPAARGVVRISGAQTASILSTLGVALPPARQPSRFASSLRTATPLAELDVDVLYWPTRRSFTGQPAAEIHTLGSPPLLAAIVSAAIAAGGRAAEPGEFTMRAFLAGRIDLTQAEAILGVIEAEGPAALDHALGQLAGNLARPLHQIRGALLDLLADVEAGLDFVDEDITFVTDRELAERLAGISAQLEQVAASIQRRGGGADRRLIALRGDPNAGKSSLLNRLAGRPAAIVSDRAGTTRDAVTVAMELCGHPVEVVDTAGIEQAGSWVGSEAQRQASEAAAHARIRLWCVDSSRQDFADACQRLIERSHAAASPAAVDLWVATKSDLGPAIGASSRWISCSAVTGQGMDTLEQAMCAGLSQFDASETVSVMGTAARAGDSIRNAARAVATAIELIHNQAGHEFVSSELRLAAERVGEVTGDIYTDDILDRVFSRFCIGK